MEYQFSKITCAGCVKNITKISKKVPGVEEVQIDITSKRGTITGNFDEKAVFKAIREGGYGVDHLQAKRLDNSTHSLLIKLIVGLVLSAPFLIEMVAMFAMPMSGSMLAYFDLALATIAQVYLGSQFYRGFYFALKNKMPNMDVLVVLGTTVAYLYSVYALFAGRPTFFETSVMLLTFIILGKYIEARAVGHTNKAVQELQKLRPAVDVKVGDIVRVVPGEAIPSDCVISEIVNSPNGVAKLDESMMTGESDLVSRAVGDKLVGATILVEGVIDVKITAVGADTVLSKIIQIVQDAQLRKAPIQDIADKVSSVFVPFIIALALGTFGIWYSITDADLATAISFFAAVVVIACPCALGLATPTAIVVGIGIGSRFGILFKGGEALQNLSSVNNIVFDKTGTLTTGVVALDENGVRTQNVTNDELRPEAAAIIARLQAKGVKVYMLTGDKAAKAAAIAAQLGIPADNVISDVLPDGKAIALEKLKADAGPLDKFAYVGDGINDAPALTVADVGIAMGDGSDIAIESGDIALLKGDLSTLPIALAISKKTIGKVKQNLFLSLFYNCVAIPVAAGALVSFGFVLSPAIAGLCMVLSSVSVVTNSLLTRAAKFDK